ncbi:(2Fe-2S)-binding protein [Paenibacillus paeoniae]|uniref:(2Fe-2S)-binding protein n=1 Tax=Paenibacillus paeoniae TaxID=2292705 RepID=UPI0010583E21|nr:(2Fe-2S)-binding protein [Paenibacillus paeoniae]
MLDKSRVEGHKQWLDFFYRGQVTPLIQTLSQVANVHVIQLWGQITNALYPQWQAELADVSDPVSRTRINECFQMLKCEIKTSAFGLRKNPFAIKQIYIEHPTIPEQKVWMKAACCLAYRLEGEIGYCYECPRLKEADTVVRREKC